MWKWIKNLFAPKHKKSEPKPKPEVESPAQDDYSTPEEVYYADRPKDLPASNHYDGWDKEKLKKEYTYLYSLAVVKPEWQRLTNQYLEKYKANKHRYEAISRLTPNRVPPKVIAVIHMKESSMDFNDHLHNGDPLTRRTVQVPAGRPKAAPKNGKTYTFEESALDALEYDGLTKVTDWSVGNMFLFLEKYNGSGYRTGAGRNTIPRNASPYIYSGTQFYHSGQYVSDGKFSSTAKAKNLGCMAFLKALDSVE